MLIIFEQNLSSYDYFFSIFGKSGGQLPPLPPASEGPDICLSAKPLTSKIKFHLAKMRQNTKLCYLKSSQIAYSKLLAKTERK